MAKSSSSFSLAQWIFILAVLWLAMDRASLILKGRVDLFSLFNPSRPAKISPEALSRTSKWQPPVDTPEEQPARRDLATLEKFRGKPILEIVQALGGTEAAPDNGTTEPIRLGPDQDGDGVFARFGERAGDTGLRFAAKNVINGSSRIELADLDGDGFRDLQAPAQPGTGNLQLQQNQADGNFAVADSEPIPAGSQVTAADYDNDGDLDLFVMRGRLPNSLLENTGGGTFRDVTESAGLLAFGWTASAQWVDFDRDGAIDLFVARNPETGVGDEPSCRLYRNEGDGTFRDLAWEAGLRFSVSIRDCTWTDLDGDGFPDLAISTIEMPGGDSSKNGQAAPAPILLLRSVPAAQPDRWRFESMAEATGLGTIDGAGRIAFRDYDQDGAVDLLAGGGAWHPFRLFRNGGNGRFEEVSGPLGLNGLTGILSLTMADLNGDGFEDLALGTADQSPNRVFLNRGGDSFREVTGPGGFGILQSTPALAAGDLDGDGDIDLVAAADWTGGALFENPGVDGHAWLTLDLEGVSANRAALGARISMVVRDRDWILHRIERIARGPRVELGLGEASAIESLEIEWPVVGWPRTIFTEVPLNRLIRIREGEAEFSVRDLKPIRLGGGEAGDESSDES